MLQLWFSPVQSAEVWHRSRSSVGSGGSTQFPFPSQLPSLPHDVPERNGSVSHDPLRQTRWLHSAGCPSQSAAELHSSLQSLSSRLIRPVGQQPSLLIVWLTINGVQLTLQELAEPVSIS